jgi:hypothetical protein
MRGNVNSSSSKLKLALLFFATLLSSCKNGSDNEGGSVNTLVQSDGTLSFATMCGVVVSNGTVNPVLSYQGRRVRSAQMLTPNLIKVTVADESFTVKLHGIDSVPATKDGIARSAVLQLLRGDIYFFAAAPQCDKDGVKLGHIVNSLGQSLGEALLARDAAIPASSSGCSEELIQPCYQALVDQAQSAPVFEPPIKAEPEPVEPQDFPFDDDDIPEPTVPGGSVKDFLWKPESDKNGKLAVLAEPYGAEIWAGNEKLVDYGSGNGRGTTGRGTKPGCSYGKNVRVRVIDPATRLPYTLGGKEVIIIPDGCQRFERKE